MVKKTIKKRVVSRKRPVHRRKVVKKGVSRKPRVVQRNKHVKKRVKKPRIKKHSLIIESDKLKLDKNYEEAYDFASSLYKKMGQMVKSIVLFGSAAKKNTVKGSDIDVIVIVDDCTVDYDEEMIEWYRKELGAVLAHKSYKDKLHVNTVTLTAFWGEILNGEPVAMNTVKYGVSLIDFGGFFSPLKILLARGKLKPSREAVYTSLKRAPVHLSRAKYNILGVVEALYWAMVDAAQAALMGGGLVPPSTEHIGDMLKEKFVKKKKLSIRYVNWYEEMFKLAHGVFHGEIVDLSSTDLKDWRFKADVFVGEMARLVGDEYE